MTSFVYFAYGSNMLRERLTARCPSARSIGEAAAPDHRIAFTKPSFDGSGKATLVRAPGETAHGVLFEIAKDERDNLRRFEGDGYRCREGFLVRAVGEDSLREVATCLAVETKDSLRPYDWYRALVVAGALQHALPEHHVAALRAVAATPDPKPRRPARLAALDALERAGFAHLLETKL